MKGRWIIVFVTFFLPVRGFLRLSLQTEWWAKIWFSCPDLKQLRQMWGYFATLRFKPRGLNLSMRWFKLLIHNAWLGAGGLYDLWYVSRKCCPSTRISHWKNLVSFLALAEILSGNIDHLCLGLLMWCGSLPFSILKKFRQMPWKTPRPENRSSRPLGIGESVFSNDWMSRKRIPGVIPRKGSQSMWDNSSFIIGFASLSLGPNLACSAKRMHVGRQRFCL